MEAQKNLCVVRAARIPEYYSVPTIRRTINPQKDCPAYLYDVPRRWICLDIDELVFPGINYCDPEQVVRFALSHLPSELQNVSTVWQLSSSAGMTNEPIVKLHLWFCLSRPHNCEELRRWVKVGVEDDLIDLALFRPVQPHYVARPIFGPGLVDPIPRRSGILVGDRQIAELPVPAAPKVKKEPKTSSRVSAKTPQHTSFSLDPTLRVVEWGELESSARQCTSAYGESVVKRQVKRLRDTQPGNRHHTLYAASALIGSFVAGGEISLKEAVKSIQQGSVRCGLLPDREAEVERTIRDGLLRGAATPRKSPSREDDHRVIGRARQMGRWEAEKQYLPPTEIGPGVAVLECDLGSGKTQQLAHHVRSLDERQHALAICHRVSLTEELSRRLGITWYRDEPTGKLEPTSRAICLDSICRIRLGTPYHTVILEESESIFHSLFHGTIPRKTSAKRAHSGKVFVQLHNLCCATLAEEGMVIAADAFAGPLTQRGLTVLCGGAL